MSHVRGVLLHGKCDTRFRITFGLALARSALGSGTEQPRDENPVGVLDFGGFPTIHDRPRSWLANEGLASLTDDLLNGLSNRTKHHGCSFTMELTPPWDMQHWLLR